MSQTETISLERLPRIAWVALGVTLLGLVYLVLQVAFVQPYLWPAGHGARVASDSRFAGGSTDSRLALARPPDIADHQFAATIVSDVLPDSAAARAGLEPGDDILQQRSPNGGRLDLRPLMMADASEQLQIWRETYLIGLRGPIEFTVQRDVDKQAVERQITVERPAAWSDAGLFGKWATRHLGLTLQVIVFIGCALTLMLLRSADVTAGLCAMALVLCGVAGGGPLMGSETLLPYGLRQIMTVFAWTATAFAFPLTGLAILYFPTRSPMVTARPWLHAVPFLISGPMIALSFMTGLFLAGWNGALGGAVWDTAHPEVFYASFALGLGLNMLAIVEGVKRYRLQEPHQQQRIRIVLWTAIPGVLAFAIRDGLPALMLLLTSTTFQLPWILGAAVQATVLLPAFGLTYAVAFDRVLGPRLVLRRSIQYALAARTLKVVAVLPSIALVISLIKQKEMTLAQIISGAPAFYIVLIGLSVAALKYREHARTWLDQHFFRQEYDARKILLSLASRVRFESDPGELASLVLGQLDEALHPEMAAILVSGIDEGHLTPVAVVHGSAESLPLHGGLVTMLRWSDEPLELYVEDPRSPARRLPADEQEWLACTGAVLIVPVLGEARALIAVLVLGQKRSEEPYTAEDRQLLGSVAAQMGLVFDVARLRSRVMAIPSSETTLAATHVVAGAIDTALAMCPRCGRCEDGTVALCSNDGVSMQRVPNVPRVVDNKYRIDQLVGRGGMGAVYRARDLRLDRNVALKMVRAELLMDADARRRFRREAQIVARLQHPSIVSIFDYGNLPDGTAFLVMEFVKGENLRQLLDRDRRVPLDRVVRIVAAVAGAIGAAHREGVLHRDLKPENILMTQARLAEASAETDAVKVLDFGIATFFGERGLDDAAMTMVTSAGTIVGTPAYMAPEQLRAAALDERTDVFSLAVVAYEMLSGQLPFGSGSLTDVVVAQIQGARPLTGPELSVPDAVEETIRSALSLDPSMRPASPQEFALALQRGAGL